MTTPPSLDPSDLDSALRDLAAQQQPRADFVSTLRGRLESQSTAQRRAPWRALLAWARPFAGQAAVILLLAGLIALAFRLTPQLLPAATPRPAQQVTATPLPNQPTLLPDQLAPNQTAPSGLPAGALERLGRGQLTALDTAADGRIAVGSTAGVCLYNTGYTEDWCIWTAAGRVRFSPSGEQIAALSSYRLRVLDARTGQTLAERSFDPEISAPASALAWDPSGAPRLLVAESLMNLNGTAGQLSAWDWQSDSLAWGPVRIDTAITGLDWAHSRLRSEAQGDSLIVAGGQNGLAFVDGETGAIIEQHDPTYQAMPVLGIRAVAFSPDGSHLAYTHANGVVMLEMPQPGTSFFPCDNPGDLAWVIEGSNAQPKLAVSAGTQIQILQPTLEGVTPEVLPAQPDSPLAWGPGQGGLYYQMADGLFARYADGQSVPITTSYVDLPLHLTWTAQDELISASGNALHAWRSGTVSQITLPKAEPLALSADGTRAAYYLPDESAVIVWDTASNQMITRLSEIGASLEGGPAPVFAAFSSDDQQIAVAYGSTVHLFDAQSGKPIREAREERAGAVITGLAWRPETTTGGQPGYSMLSITWMVANATSGVGLVSLDDQISWQTLTLYESGQAAVSPTWTPDGRLLCALVGSDVFVLDVEVNQVRWTMNGPGTNRLAISPDSRYLAGGWANKLYLWDLQTGQLERSYDLPAAVGTLAFNPNDNRLASIGADGTLLIWDTTGQAPAQPAPVESTPTPLPIPGGSTPDSGAAPTEAPVEMTATPLPTEPVDATQYKLSTKTIENPDSGRSVEVLRGEVLPGSVLEEDYNRISVKKDNGSPLYTYVYNTRHGPAEPHPDGFVFSADGRFFYFYDTMTPTRCAAPINMNLRRMDLSSGQVESALVGGPDMPGAFSLSPDGHWWLNVYNNIAGVQDVQNQASQQLLVIAGLPQAVRLTSRDPLWSPDGAWVTYNVVASDTSGCETHPALLGAVFIRLTGTPSAEFLTLPANINDLPGTPEGGKSFLMIDENGERYRSSLPGEAVPTAVDPQTISTP